MKMTMMSVATCIAIFVSSNANANDAAGLAATLCGDFFDFYQETKLNYPEELAEFDLVIWSTMQGYMTGRNRERSSGSKDLAKITEGASYMWALETVAYCGANRSDLVHQHWDQVFDSLPYAYYGS